MPATRQTPAALVTRTVVWIVISSFFLYVNLKKISEAHAAHLVPTPWVYVQLALWSVALLFWLYTGWRDWTKHPSM